MTSIKITYQEETRRVLLRENGETLNYEKLINTLLNLFPTLCGKTFSLTWEDEEGDLIVCSSDAELDDAIHVMTLQGRTLKFGVKLGDSAPTAPSSAQNGSTAPPVHSVHTSVTCDECGMSPIIGIRFKCAIRHDFDLCGKCEAKKIQPYPMIKITDPSQAPEVLIYGLRDGQRNEEGVGGFHGRHWQRGHRHPHHFAPPDANPNNNCPPNNGGGCPWKRGGRGRCGEWGRKLEKFASDIAKDPVVAPFIQAMDSAVKDFMGPDSNNGSTAAPNASTNANPAANPAAEPPIATKGTVATEKPSEVQLEEQRLLEQAILESLTINEGSEDKPNKPAEYVETSRPAVITLPKPALRFVRDVTFPDGTSVQPGAVFRKTWRVRNDGNHSWPDGASLVSVGGDVLSNQEHREPLPILQPEQESEIGLQLTAPHLPGMYTAYYRAQTKEQQYFGQRLWAAIVVTDTNQGIVNANANEDWLEINPSAASTVSEENKPDDNSAQPIVSSPVASVAPVSVEAITSVAPPPPPPAAAAAPVQPPAHLRSAMLLWRRELAILEDMGFSDVEVIIPLLQQHFSSPLSLNADKNAVPPVEGMQQVVATLLSMQFN